MEAGRGVKRGDGGRNKIKWGTEKKRGGMSAHATREGYFVSRSGRMNRSRDANASPGHSRALI